MAYQCGNTDRISLLPSEIIEKILNLLSCRDAIRTSILSSDWRYKWISMTDLNFWKEAWVTEDKYAQFITECLLRLQGPIRKFSVAGRIETIERKLEHWMKLVSKHDIEELQVGSYYGYRILRSSSSCLSNCKKLRHLELYSCMLDVPPTFEGFMNLRVLNLSFINVMDKSRIESLISKSPLLESISLCISGFSNIASITISAPKIKYLSLEGNLERTSLEKSPVLVDMSITFWGYPKDCDFIKFLGGAPNLEKLTVKNVELCSKRVETGCCRGVLSATFSYLKVMTLTDFYLHESRAIPLVIELLRSVPNLEKLVIHNDIISHPLSKKVGSDFWKEEYLVGHCFMKLKVVKVGYLLCMAPEIEFVKFILLNSPILEKLTIRTHERKWSQKMLTYLLEKLPTLPRASAHVAVTLMVNKLNGDQTVVWTN